MFRHCQDKIFLVPVFEGGRGLRREMYEPDQSLNFTNTIQRMKQIEWLSVSQESRRHDMVRTTQQAGEIMRGGAPRKYH